MAHEDWDAQSAFRAGFLLRCAQEGLDEAGIEKRAQLALGAAKAGNWLTGTLQGVGKLLSGGGSALKNTGLYALGVPFAVGTVGGYTLGKSTGAGREPEELRDQELAAALNSYAEQLERRNARLRRERAGRV